MNICCQPFAKLVFKVILLCLSGYTETFPTETGVGVFRPWKTWSLIGNLEFAQKTYKVFFTLFFDKVCATNYIKQLFSETPGLSGSAQEGNLKSIRISALNIAQLSLRCFQTEMANSCSADDATTGDRNNKHPHHHSNSSDCDVNSNHEYDSNSNSNNEPTSISLEVELNGHSDPESKVGGESESGRILIF